MLDDAKRAKSRWLGRVLLHALAVGALACGGDDKGDSTSGPTGGGGTTGTTGGETTSAGPTTTTDGATTGGATTGDATTGGATTGGATTGGTEGGLTGTPCSTDADCAGLGGTEGRCMTDWPGGSCSVECTLYLDCPNEDEDSVVCEALSGQSSSQCLTACLQNDDCRDGYECSTTLFACRPPL